MIIGYIKNTEDKSDYKEQHDSITAFANDNSVNLSSIYASLSIEDLKQVIPPDCKGIIFNNISILGANLHVIRDNLRYFSKRKINLYSIADNYHFTPETLTEEMLQGIDLAIDIRYHMTSFVTKKALARKKASGFKLGRKGKPNRKIVLQNKESELYLLLDSGMPKIHIAKKLGVCVATLYNFLNRNHSIVKGAENV